MNSPETPKKKQNVGGQAVEKLSFNSIEKKHNISREELLHIIEELLTTVESRRSANDSIPVLILRSPILSSLEAIVKFLRENRGLSYNIIGERLGRNPKTLAVSYAVAHRKMSEPFSKEFDDDDNRIPFNAFSEGLSILEAVCTYLKSLGNSYADIARMLDKDQRTIWTVCKRAEHKMEVMQSEGGISEEKTSKEKRIDEKYGR
jgi:hypothetical protein